jgi:hypothetical protein
VADTPAEGRIEPVRGAITDERAGAILDFWSKHDALPEAEAQGRLPEVLCVLRDEGSEIAGVNSAFQADLGLVGGRSFWIYRSYLLPEAADADPAMINAAFDALEAEFDPRGDGPIGLCVVLADPAEIARRRDAVWPETELMYAGYLRDGRQVRIRYFDGAAIGPALPNSPSLSETRATEYTLGDRYRILPFDQADAVAAEDVIAFWEREGAVGGEEANRRVHEVHLIVTERDQEVVGVSSAYLQRNPQLRMDLWYYRAYVGREHRMSDLAGLLAIQGRDLLKGRFSRGEDTRAAGIVYEVENDGLKRYFNLALWLPTEFTFIGENQRGDHVRVHYFPGAQVPEPA